MFKKLVDWEEDMWNEKVERVAEKYPAWFWNDGAEKGRMPLRWDVVTLDHWPKILTFSYWYYLFHDLEGKEWWGSDPNPNWINIPEWGEIRYLFYHYDWETKSYKWRFDLKWAWIQLTDETKGRRLLCRIKGHPKGEIYYNPGGSEPDHRCQDCGESIG